MLNRVILIGRMTRDPEMKYTTSGTAVANFTLAINRKFNKEETDFIDIVAWRQSAEFCGNYGAKGRLTMVEGRLQIRSYEAKDGTKRKVAEVVADDLRFLDKQQGAGNGEAKPQQKPHDEWDELGKGVGLGDIDIVDGSESEIPF